MGKLKMFWGTGVMPDTKGNLYGYASMVTNLREYVEKRNDCEFVPLEQAECALYLTTPEVFDPPKTSAPMVLFTMFEGLKIPDIYLNNMKKADYLIVPSHWVKGLFVDYGFSEDRVFVVPLGVHPDFTYKERNLSHTPFRYLWVGAPNPRKGYGELAVIWDKLGMVNHPELELYLKSSKIPNVQLSQLKNVILDGRNLPRDELVKLYHSAHCFVFPTRGEGFALTLAEAMATGLPCIATNWGGLTEFFDKQVGFPVGYEMGENDIISPIWGNMGKTTLALPELKEVAEWMIWIRKNYKEAVKVGKKASMRIKVRFTWNSAAEKLVKTLQGVVQCHSVQKTM